MCILSISPEHLHDQSSEVPFQAFWGGPDRPQRCLRDLLEERINGVPSGGEILWITYYFRDEGLAQALLKASQRGVKVRVVMEGSPRTETANSRVIELLAAEGALGENLRVISHSRIDKRFKSSRLHEKLYYFSHPVPRVLVGTFNPSGNLPEDPEIISEIGDQDRGHNVLVEFLDQALVRGLYAHAQRLFCSTHGPWERFLPQNNRVISSGKIQALFFPRLRRTLFYNLLSGLDADSRLRMAVSHLSDPDICKRLIDLVRQGVHVEILTHDTERRVPSWVEEEMLRKGVIFNRYVHPEGLPMHNKFILIDALERQLLVFGSMNLSIRSLNVNHELLIIAEDSTLYHAFQHRWGEMLKESSLATKDN
jgi:phosphatidylserine/phosphatidylglycerophosphate/cardiolipin synthase-like enzyme